MYLFTRPTHRNSWEHLTRWHLYRTHAYWNYFFRYHQIQRSLQLWLEIPWAAVCSARCGLVPSQTSRATRGHSPESFAVRQGPGTQTLFWCTGETWSGWFLENLFDKETFEYSQTVFHRSVERELKIRGKKVTQKPAVTEQEVPSLARPYSAFPPQSSSLVITLDERKRFFQTLRTETFRLFTALQRGCFLWFPLEFCEGYLRTGGQNWSPRACLTSERYFRERRGSLVFYRPFAPFLEIQYSIDISVTTPSWVSHQKTGWSPINRCVSMTRLCALIFLGVEAIKTPRSLSKWFVPIRWHDRFYEPRIWSSADRRRFWRCVLHQSPDRHNHYIWWYPTHPSTQSPIKSTPTPKKFP